MAEVTTQPGQEPKNEERSWWENFEAHVGNTINEMRLQIENNRREVAEQWEVMQEIQTQHNEIMMMIENLQVAMYNSKAITKVVSDSGPKTQNKGTFDSGKSWSL
jgi:hypothetical protein